MKQIMMHLFANRSDILAALSQHIILSVVALIVAICLAVPLAISVRYKPKLAQILLNIAHLVQTIPSLALLGLLIPFVGIGFTPALIALVLYAVMPIFQNTYTGLSTIDEDYQQAMAALGLSSKLKLWKIELPLARPMILAGIKIAGVMIIGTATLAALIGAGGLGTFIIVGMETNNNFDLVLGGMLAASLALIFSLLITWLNSPKRRKWSILGLLILIIFAGGYSLRNVFTSHQETVTIAGKLGAEPEILMNMYKDLIEADDPKIKVQLKPNFGNTMFLFNALKAGQIDIYPEFTGTVVQSILKEEPKSQSAKQIYNQAQTNLAKQYNLTYLKPMKYQNNYALAVSNNDPKTKNITMISDTLKDENNLKVGFSTDFAHQPSGYPGLQKTYGINYPKLKTFDPSLRYLALAEGKVDLIDVYTTDPEIAKYHLRILKDNKHFFPSYQGAPLMKTSFAKQHPQIVKSLNKLAGQITTKEMQQMNYEVVVEKKKASQVAYQYLVQHKLLPRD